MNMSGREWYGVGEWARRDLLPFAVLQVKKKGLRPE